MKSFFSFLALLGTAWAAGSWVLMLAIGALHHEWWAAIPTISFAGALKIELVLILGVTLGVAIKSLAGAVHG